MSDEVLFFPRRLAIRLLHEAQVAGEAEVRGLIGADATGPCSLHPGATQTPLGLRTWAVYRRCTDTPAAPDIPKDAYLLGISLDTKGVLQLRCWDAAGTEPRERELKIRENS